MIEAWIFQPDDAIVWLSYKIGDAQIAHFSKSLFWLNSIHLIKQFCIQNKANRRWLKPGFFSQMMAIVWLSYKIGDAQIAHFSKSLFWLNSIE